jgi:hypothetical protein
VRDNYYRGGTRVWELDVSESERCPLDPGNLCYYLGNGHAVAENHPLTYSRAFNEGMCAEGDRDDLPLIPSA